MGTIVELLVPSIPCNSISLKTNFFIKTIDLYCNSNKIAIDLDTLDTLFKSCKCKLHIKSIKRDLESVTESIIGSIVLLSLFSFTTIKLALL